MEDVGDPRADPRDDDAPQRVAVAGGNRRPSGVEGGELLELGQTDGGVDIGHAEVVAQHVVVVPHRHAMLPPQAGPVGQVGVRGRDHPPLAGRHVLGGVEAEHALAPGSGVSPVDGGTVALGRILDDRDAMPFGDLADGRHVGGLPYRLTGMTARVLGVMAASRSDGSMQKSRGWTSTKTGRAPV